jgi:elongation factor 1-delta
MSAQCFYMDQSFWTDKLRYDQAEANYQEFLAGVSKSAAAPSKGSSLVSEIAKAREQIKQSLSGSNVGSSISGSESDIAVVSQIQTLQAENKELRKVTEDLSSLVKRLEARVAALEVSAGGAATTPAKTTVEKPVAKKEEKSEDEEEDDFELFGDDDDDDDEEDSEEAERIKAERVAAYNEKKSKKAAVIAKSSVLLDVKPWDDETDMKAMEDAVRTIEMDGLVWGASKLVPVGYGIKKLTIMCVVEDEKVSIDELSDLICEFEDFVQSVDIAAFNKI